MFVVTREDLLSRLPKARFLYPGFHVDALHSAVKSTTCAHTYSLVCMHACKSPLPATSCGGALSTPGYNQFCEEEYPVAWVHVYLSVNHSVLA